MNYNVPMIFQNKIFMCIFETMQIEIAVNLQCRTKKYVFVCYTIDQQLYMKFYVLLFLHFVSYLQVIVCRMIC